MLETQIIPFKNFKIKIIFGDLVLRHFQQLWLRFIDLVLTIRHTVFEQVTVIDNQSIAGHRGAAAAAGAHAGRGAGRGRGELMIIDLWSLISGLWSLSNGLGKYTCSLNCWKEMKWRDKWQAALGLRDDSNREQSNLSLIFLKTVWKTTTFN